MKWKQEWEWVNRSNIQLNGPEHEVLRDLADRVAEDIKSIDGVFNPESGSRVGVPQMQVDVDQEKAALYGFNC